MENTLENAMTFFLKMNKEGIYTGPDIMVAYAASVSPKLVMPSEDEAGCIALTIVPDLEEVEQSFFVAGFQTCIRYLNTPK